MKLSFRDPAVLLRHGREHNQVFTAKESKFKHKHEHEAVRKFPSRAFHPWSLRQDWVRATEALMEMGKAGMAPSAKYARQWRLASAAIEEIDIGTDDDEETLVSRG